MKKYLLGAVAFACLLGASFDASAQMKNSMQSDKGTYVLADVGYGFGTGAFDDTVLFGVGAGYKMDKYLRSDVIVEYRGWGDVDYQTTTGKHHSDVWSVPVLMNVYGTYPIYDGIGVYAMGGLGVSYNKTDDFYAAKGEGKFDFAWNLGAGIEYELNDCWSMDLGYRYTDLGKAKVKVREGFLDRKGKDLESHDIKLTVRYHF